MTTFRGFTLTELLVVLALVGLLSAMALAGLSESRAQVRDAAKITEMQNVSTALRLYAKDRGHYPNTLYTLVQTAYLTRLPAVGGGWVYAVADDGSRYYLGVNLELTEHGALEHDADNARHGISGRDTSGCSNEFAQYCYDLSAPLP